MADKADELYLPNAVLLRIIKDSLPERTIVNREARSAISKAVSSFILYVTSLASAHCSNAKRKTLTADDIFAALKEMQFDHYLPTLTTFLQNCRSKSARKKLENQTSTAVAHTSTVDTNQEDDADNDDEPGMLDEVTPSKRQSPTTSTSSVGPSKLARKDDLNEVDLTERTSDEESQADESDQDDPPAAEVADKPVEPSSVKDHPSKSEDS